MTEINLDELDERTARVMLAMVAEPRDTTVHLAHDLGGIRTVHLALGGESLGSTRARVSSGGGKTSRSG